MKLVIIFLALLALRYVTFEKTSMRYRGFIFIAQKIQKILSIFHSGWLSCLVIVLPGVFLLFFIENLTKYWLLGSISFVINVCVLWYCLWPQSLEDIFLSNNQIKEDEVNLNGVSTTKATERRNISEKILVAANENTFAVLLWFLLFGAGGAFLYRSVTLLRQGAENDNLRMQRLWTAAIILQSLLDWLPARLTALTYVIAGDFVPGFAEWKKEVWSGLKENTKILVRTGLAASGFDYAKQSDADLEENRILIRMTDRALIVCIILTAILTLGRWLY